MSFEIIKKFHEMGLILIPMTVKDGEKIPLIEYKGYAEKGQDLVTLSGLFESYKDVKPLHWAVYCVNGIVGLDFDSPKDYEIFFSNLETLTTRSPSRGYHIVLKSLQKCRSFKILGTEIKVNELLTIVGEGYEPIKDVPVKELEDACAFIKKKFPKVVLNNDLKDIKISDIIQKFTKKEKDFHGGWTAFCPLHGDTKTDHFYVYESTNTFHCFKCKKSGDGINFIKELKSLSSKNEAVEYIKHLLKIETRSNIPTEDIEPIETNIDDVIAEFEKNLHIDDKVTITIPISFTIGNFTPCDPDVLGIIAPSGSGKTEVIRALGDTENQFVYPLSSMTSHTFVSGFKDSKDLAPQLKNRLVTIKDFTTILSKKSDEVGGIFADIRDVTDGYIQKTFGSEVGKKEYRSLHTSFLFACTNAIERYYSMYSILGQRLIFFRPITDAKKARQKAMQNAGHEKDIREKHHKLVMRLVNTVLTSQKERLQDITHGLPADMIERIGTLCDFLAVVRTHINRDVKGDMCALPEPEMPTRLTKTLCKMVDVHSILYNRIPVIEDELIALRLVHDNIPTERAIILRVLSKYSDFRSTPDIGAEAKTPTNMTGRVLNDLMALGIVEKKSRDDAGSRSDMWLFPLGDFKTAFLTIMNIEIMSAVIERLRGVDRGDSHKLTVIDLYYYVNHFIFNNNYNIIKKEDRESLIDAVCNHLCDLHPSINQDAAPQQSKPKGQETDKKGIELCLEGTDTIDFQEIFEKGKLWEKNNGPINTSNVVAFSMWYCDQSENDHEPGKIKEIVSKLFGITPEKEKNSEQPGSNGSSAEQNDLIVTQVSSINVLGEEIPIEVSRSTEKKEAV
ncbi:MAG TPA: CHC2 zinc finger domain-containing protein [Candidatus Methylomirabilis sp.]|nr:CHC2 zinc finger domain-containing protein [Candidatus Methylomirabilis sp.]